MSRIPLTVDAVAALSPDDASTKAARGLVAPAKWPMLGASDAAVWGECQGSDVARQCGLRWRRPVPSRYVKKWSIAPVE